MTNGLAMRATRFVTVVIACGASIAAPASGSQLIDRNATQIRLEVNAGGEALITYRAHGKVVHVLAWGAINALPPTADAAQVEFKLDYSGGWKAHHRAYWQTFTNGCTSYRGPPLPWQLAACTAPDGSFWALQAWQRALPDYGVKPSSQQSTRELRLSHWTGPLAVLSVQLDWAYRKYDHLFGTLSYEANGVHGFHSTSSGLPLDAYGRNIYLDTLDSAYGPGWKRENSFLTHGPNGSFCYGFYAHGSHPAGAGSRYRITVIGPGVTPDVSWEGTAPGPYDPTAQTAAAGELRALGDPTCSPR